eukprot:gene3663-4215_t
MSPEMLARKSEFPGLEQVCEVASKRSDSDDQLVNVIYGIEPVSAPHYTPQSVVYNLYNEKTTEKAFLAGVYKNCKIKNRYFFNDLTKPLERQTSYLEAVKSTIIEAGERVIRSTGIDRANISHVVGVTSTGLIAPSIDALLIRSLDLPDTCARTMVNFMGCGAAVIGLRTATNAAHARPGTYVLMVACEMSSAGSTDRDYNSKSEIVSGAIFADGCAAAIVSCQPRRDVRGHLEIIDDISYLMKDSGDALFMTMGTKGFDLTLRPQLPVAIATNIKPTMTKFLEKHGLTISDIQYWAVHPGGRKILEAVHEGLELSSEDLSESYEVMKWYGNMVSCSALFVLRRVLDKIKRIQSEGGHTLESGVVMAFSPGASIEAMLLRTIV